MSHIRNLPDVTEIYASECCGGVFVPGHGPDNIHDAERGDQLIIESESAPGRENQYFQRVYRVDHTTATLYDAVRAGPCPCCGEPTPGLTLLLEVENGA